jgi:hypothetical protein
LVAPTKNTVYSNTYRVHLVAPVDNPVNSASYPRAFGRAFHVYLVALSRAFGRAFHVHLVAPHYIYPFILSL